MPAVIVSACRTPIGSFLGALSPLTAAELGAVALREAVSRAGVAPEEVEEVILGHVLSGGAGQAPARQASLKAGLPPSVGVFAVHKVCGSGLKSVMLADQAIRAGDARIIAAGGMESMSNAPYVLPKARTGYRLGHDEIIDSMIRDGLWDAYNDYHMGMTGELCAREYRVSRQDQDEWSAQSYVRALAAQQAGAFDQEIVHVEVAGRKSTTVVTTDEEPRATSLETLSGLRTAFDKTGTITAGNASKISDGAAALLVMDEDEARKRSLKPLARIVASSTHSREPEWLMMAPEGAIRKVLARAGWEGADLYEINEAFAAATVALVRELKLDPDQVNVNGGAVALGHPIGATGARILVTLIHAMQARGVRRGIAALCLGGGEAVALAVERE